ncbi:hypothetical protein B5L92_05050, partial [Klebsiella pneumoniae]
MLFFCTEDPLFVQSGSSVQLTFPIRARRGQWSGLISVKEGANKQVISSQADSLIKISRIWADF